MVSRRRQRGISRVGPRTHRSWRCLVWLGLAVREEELEGILRGVMWKMVHPSEGPEGLLPSYAAGKERGLEKAVPQSWKCQHAWKCQDEELGLLPEGTVGRARHRMFRSVL